ncbi:hypothetical protein [Myroides odoratimimus]|uniref:HNH endonuclease n=1 Tax=Myroides odoratimimus TaxID=76832 RepID=UPI0031012906
MKRIKIDSNLTLSVKSFNTNLFADKDKRFVKPKEKLKILFNNLVINNQKNYLDKILKEYDSLLNLKPSEFSQKKQEFDAIYIIDNIEGSESTIFAKKIVEALRYDEYRDSQYPKLINSLKWNLKVCFYCNYAGTLTIKEGKKYKAYYDLDHVLPKSLYPFLATTFFNFIPVCASCNRKKSNKIINNLNPFYEDTEKGVGLGKIFEITKESKAQFYLDFDKNQIEIKISDKINKITTTDFNEVVNLESLYNTQKDEAEEILWKKRIYTKEYISTIQSSFSSLKLKEKEINRFLWGTDLDEDKINDKPLAKFKIDLINEI